MPCDTGWNVEGTGAGGGQVSTQVPKIYLHKMVVFILSRLGLHTLNGRVVLCLLAEVWWPPVSHCDACAGSLGDEVSSFCHSFSPLLPFMWQKVRLLGSDPSWQIWGC